MKARPMGRGATDQDDEQLAREMQLLAGIEPAPQSASAETCPHGDRSPFANFLNPLVHCRIEHDDTGKPADLHFLRVNRAFAESTGLGDVTGRLASEVIGDVLEQDPLVLEQLAEVARSGVANRFEIELRSRREWYSMSACSPASGEVVITTDRITDRKRTEAIGRMQGRFMEMIASGEPLAAVLHEMCVQIEAFDEGTLVSVHLLDVDGTTLRQGAAPGLPAAYNAAIDGAQIGPEQGSCGAAAYTRQPVIVEDIETSPLWKDYRDLALQHGLHACWSTPVLDPSGKVLGTFALYRRHRWQPRDYQGRVIAMATHAAAVAIRRHNEEQVLRKLSLAVDQSAESIIITDLTGRIEYVNEAFVRISGYAREEVIGRTPALLRSGRTSKETYRKLWQTLLRGESWRGEFINRRKDGREFHETCVVTPLRQPDGTITHYLAMKTDVTEKKRITSELALHRHHLEELVEKRTAELAAAKLQAESSSRAKGTFLANMSHEIRTPMNAILGLTHILRQETDDPAHQGLLEKLSDSGRHLMQVINGVLDLSKIEAGKLTLDHSEFALGGVLRGVTSLLAHEAQAKDIHVEVQVVGVDSVLRGDATRLSQALLNFVTNAIKFTPRGTVTIRAIAVKENATSQLVRFEVQDSGIGIDPEQLSQAVQCIRTGRFVAYPPSWRHWAGTRHHARPAQLMGGHSRCRRHAWDRQHVLVHRIAGKTSIAAYTDSPSRGRTSVADFALDATQQRNFEGRVLLAEDNPTNQSVMLRLLRDMGLHVDLAENGLEAVERLRRPAVRPDPDGRADARDGRARGRRAIRGLPAGSNAHRGADGKRLRRRSPIVASRQA